MCLQTKISDERRCTCKGFKNDGDVNTVTLKTGLPKIRRRVERADNYDNAVENREQAMRENRGCLEVKPILISTAERQASLRLRTWKWSVKSIFLMHEFVSVKCLFRLASIVLRRFSYTL